MHLAIIGASIELPGVDDLAGLHDDFLSAGTHFERLDEAELAAAHRRGADTEHPRYVPVHSALPTAGMFDPGRFAMSDTEAQWTDPQHRLLLTLTHRALDGTGIDTGGREVGTYVTVSTPTYLAGRAGVGPHLVSDTIDYRAFVGTDRDFAASRLASRLGFSGPALTVQSACSSSLVALHHAGQALATGDIDTAVVGGASIIYPDRIGYRYADGGVASPTGRSRPFDRDSDGTIRGSGGGVVVLRRLDDALAANEVILGVVAATAVNNDAGTGMSFTAPSVSGQERVLATAVRRAGVDPGTVGYVETHGTGTPIGDPIEVRALRRVYDRADTAPCHLGSAKANFGHLDVAAGILGLIRAMLVLRHGVIYPQAGFAEPNPDLRLDETRFAVATRPTELNSEYAAVSSFGMGGTNAHVILRRPPSIDGCGPDTGPVRITVSARTPELLQTYRLRLADHLRTHPDVSLGQVAATLSRRRREPHAAEFVVADIPALITRLVRTDSSPAPDPAPMPAAIATTRRVWLPSAPLDERMLLLAEAVADDGAPPAPTTIASTGADPRGIFLSLTADALGRDVGYADDFFDVGGESMTLVDIVGRFADRTGRKPDFAALDGLTLIGDLADALIAHSSAPTEIRGSDSIAALLTIGDGTPSAYFHPPAGGTNFCYVALQKLLPATTLASFRAIDGRRSIPEIAAHSVETLREGGHLHDGLVLGGYSFGGNVTFEIARLLEGEGIAVGGLLLIDSYAPHAFRSVPESISGSGRELAEQVADLLGDAAEGLPGFQPGQDTDAGGHAISQGFAERWEANSAALRDHRPADGIRAPITLLRARTRPDDDWAATFGVDPEHTVEWSGYTSGTFTTTTVPGDHYTMFTRPANLSVLAAAVARALPVAAVSGNES